VKLSVIGELSLAAAGLAVFISGDLLSHPTLRIVGGIVITLAVVVAAILSVTRDHDRD
jgi:hypothetical protein